MTAPLPPPGGPLPLDEAALDDMRGRVATTSERVALLAQARAAIALRERCERQERLLAELRPVVRAAVDLDESVPPQMALNGKVPVSVERLYEVRYSLTSVHRAWALADEPQGGSA